MNDRDDEITRRAAEGRPTYVDDVTPYDRGGGSDRGHDPVGLNEAAKVRRELAVVQGDNARLRREGAGLRAALGRVLTWHERQVVSPLRTGLSPGVEAAVRKVLRGAS